MALARKHPNKPATGNELHELFHQVFALHAALSAVMDQVHEHAGLRTSHCRVADSVERLGSASVPQVAAELGVSRQFVQTVCNQLEGQGLLAFHESPRHKRSKLAALTDKGKRVLARADGAEAAIIQGALPGVDAAQVSNATALIAGLVKRISSR